MKILYGTAVVLLAVLRLGAQITLTQSDMPQVGNVLITASDTAPTVTPGQAGPDQTWDLSAIRNQVAETTFCVTPSSTPYSTDFPSANLAARYVFKSASTFAYSNLSSGSLLSLGNIAVETAATISLSDNPAITTMPLPATYLTHWSSAPRMVTKDNTGVDSLEQISLLSITDTVDGWGTGNNSGRIIQFPARKATAECRLRQPVLLFARHPFVVVSVGHNRRNQKRILHLVRRFKRRTCGNPCV